MVCVLNWLPLGPPRSQPSFIKSSGALCCTWGPCFVAKTGPLHRLHMGLYDVWLGRLSWIVVVVLWRLHHRVIVNLHWLCKLLVLQRKRFVTQDIHLLPENNRSMITIPLKGKQAKGEELKWHLSDGFLMWSRGTQTALTTPSFK